MANSNASAHWIAIRQLVSNWCWNDNWNVMTVMHAADSPGEQDWDGLRSWVKSAILTTWGSCKKVVCLPACPPVRLACLPACLLHLMIIFYMSRHHRNWKATTNYELLAAVDNGASGFCEFAVGQAADNCFCSGNWICVELRIVRMLIWMPNELQLNINISLWQCHRTWLRSGCQSAGAMGVASWKLQPDKENGRYEHLSRACLTSKHLQLTRLCHLNPIHVSNFRFSYEWSLSMVFG